MFFFTDTEEKGMEKAAVKKQPWLPLFHQHQAMGSRQSLLAKTLEEKTQFEKKKQVTISHDHSMTEDTSAIFSLGAGKPCDYLEHPSS